jgi:hypothetical protein
MAENKKSFLLYCDLIHTVSKMPKEKAGELFVHILEYVNDKEPKTDDLIIELTFEPIKQSLKRDLQKYERIRQKNVENANKRWNKENATACDRIQTDTKNAVNDNDNDNDSVNDILLKKETKNNVFNFKKKLVDYGFDEKLVSEWLLIRKNKKATNTETAFKKFISQIELAPEDKNEILKLIIEKDWKGFEYQWLVNLQNEFKKQNQNGQSREQPLLGRQTRDTFVANATGWDTP